MFLEILLALTLRLISAARLRLPDRAARPQLCEPSVVSETCSLLGVKGAPNISFDNLKDALSCTAKQLEIVWFQFGFSEHVVSCMELCEAVRFGNARVFKLPPRSDVGCRAVGSRTLCDVNLGSATVAKEAMNLGDTPMIGESEAVDEPSVQNSLDQSDLDRSMRKVEAAPIPQELLLRMALLFRIFPPLSSGIDFDEVGASLLERVDVRGRSGNGRNRIEMENVKSVSLKAQAWINIAIRHYNAAQTSKPLKRWFGEDASTSEAIRKQVQSRMHSVNDVLRKVVFREGDSLECKGSYAYTDAFKKKTFWARRPIIYICDSFGTMPTSHQIETLVHEASHLASPKTYDICMKSGFMGCEVYAYGRDLCQELAIKEPARAMANADSLCYYVQEVVDFVACHSDNSCSQSCNLAVKNAIYREPGAVHENLMCECQHGMQFNPGNPKHPSCEERVDGDDDRRRFDPVRLWGKLCICGSEL